MSVVDLGETADHRRQVCRKVPVGFSDVAVLALRLFRLSMGSVSSARAATGDDTGLPIPRRHCGESVTLASRLRTVVGSVDPMNPLPKQRRRTALSRFPLIDHGLARRTRRGRRIALASGPVVVGRVGLLIVIGRNLIPVQRRRSLLRPHGLLKVRVQEGVGVRHGRARSQTTKRRARVVRDAEATILGGRVQCLARGRE